MSVIQTWFSQDLQKAVKVNYIDGNLFSHNGNGNIIGVRVYNDGEPVTLTGTVSGYVITSDGSTVPCVGARSGNEATITIPPAAYQPGNAFITIFLTDGSTVTTLCAAQTTVLQARTGSQVSPGSVVMDWTQTINAAMQSVEDAAENLGGIIATPYASLTYPVPLGKYTYYNSNLYRCISPIETSEEFTAAHWIQVKLGDDVSALKSAIGDFVYKNKPIAGYKYIHMPVMDAISAGTTIFAKALNVTSDIESIWLTGKYNSNTQDLINLTDGQEHIYTTRLNFTDVTITVTLSGDNRTDGNTTYEAICITNAKNDTVTSMLLENQDDIISLNNRLDSPFAVEISDKFKGIVGFQFLVTPPSDSAFSAINNQKYRITNIYYKDAFYLYLSMERLVNGEWVAYDNITILLANAPTENALMFAESNYNRFRMAYLPGLMQAGRATNIEYTIKNTAINPFITKLQADFDEYVPYDSYEIKPTIRTRVTVKKDGTGDYATIGAAYAAISGKSSFFNQYEVCVYPGVYEEVNLICPAYTHTHGMFPNTVTVTSEGKTGTLPVFDQTNRPSRLSNMKIISATGYCIHIDNPLIHSVVNENLYCKKIYASDVSDFGWESISTSAIIGMGAQPAGMMIVFDGCTFENGAVVCHTNSSPDENADFSLVFNNCKVLNARIQLNKAGNTGAALYGNWLCKINNLAMVKGQTNPGIALLYGDAVSGMDYNFGWQIIGGNINTAIEFKKNNDPTAPDCWDNIQLTEKTYIQAKSAITKGQWVTDGMIPATANEDSRNIVGIALANALSGDTCPVWTGNAFMLSGANGEYGIGSDGNLSASATVKIGKIISNTFYRY